MGEDLISGNVPTALCLSFLTVHLDRTPPSAPTFSTKSEAMLWDLHPSEPLSQGRVRTIISPFHNHTPRRVWAHIQTHMSGELKEGKETVTDTSKKIYSLATEGDLAFRNHIKTLIKDKRGTDWLAFSQDMAWEVHWLCFSGQIFWPCS